VANLNRVSTAQDLARWLADLPLARLTELLEKRELPYAAHGYGSPGLSSVGKGAAFAER
jgi:hypothetical protein